jgi:hypothetical protein
VARPRFVAAAEMIAEENAVTLLSSAVLKVQDAVLADDALRAAHLARFHEWAGSILSLEPRAHEAWSILRFDSFLTDEGLHFVEVNGDIPMGSVGNDGAVRLFQQLDFLPAFRRRYDVRPNLVNIGMVQTFLHAWQVWGGTGTPRICVLAFPGGMQDIFATLNEELMAGMGLEVTAAHPEDLEFRHGRLLAKGRAVDLVYRLQHVYDCLERADEMTPLFEALRREAVCMVNPFRSAVTSHKGLFALLSDPSYDFHFTREEQVAIDMHVPWGRCLRDGRSTDEDGRTLDGSGPKNRAGGSVVTWDFQFPQQAAGEKWTPAIVDYLYTAYTNIIAFSPTDTMPLTPRVKLLFTMQSAISLMTILVTLSRAVNMIPAG